MGHSDLSVGIGPIAATQFGGGQPYTPDRRPLVSKREEENHHQRVQDRYEDDEDHEPQGEEAEQPSETLEPVHTLPPELEPLSASIRGPEQHLGLLLDVKL
jgi:hypothetical protein